MPHPLVDEFVAAERQLKESLRVKDSVSAQARYRDLNDVYSRMVSSALDDASKQVAYEQLTGLYDEVAKLKPAKKSGPRNWLSDRDLGAIAFFLILFIFVLVFKPSLVGLVVADTRTVDIGMGFNQDAEYVLRLAGPPSRIMLSGTVSGEGTARVYVLRGSDRLLLFDSTSDAKGGSFTDVCGEACSLEGLGSAVTLQIDVDRATLFLSQATAVIDPSRNHPPVWNGFTTSFVVAKSQPLTVDLRQSFSDPDGDDLVFLSTAVPDLDVVVSDSLVTIDASRATAGDRELVFMASDLVAVTKQRVSIMVQDR